MSSLYVMSEISAAVLQATADVTAKSLSMTARAFETQAMFLDNLPLCKAFANAGRLTAAQLDLTARLFRHTGTRHTAAPPYDITSVPVRGRTVSVTETDVMDDVFYALKHFKKEKNAPTKPKLLIVAPMSGHYGSLLRSTVKGLLADHDVYMLDWKNPRDISSAHGVFSFERYMDCLLDVQRQLGAGTHVMGISQSTVPLLAASAFLAQTGDAAAPHSMTLIGGPIDTRKSKSPMHDFVRSQPLAWFKQTIIDIVPDWFKGKGRKVYPGTTQLAALMSQGSDKHRNRLVELYGSLSSNAPLSAELEDFYKDYFAVMDLDERFFLDTLRHVYKDHSLARGTMTYQGKNIDLAALKNTALLTIEGAKDGIALPGETHAAHDLCPNIPAHKRAQFTHPDYGHYGIALGARFQKDIAPKITAFIHKGSGKTLSKSPHP